MAIEQAKRAFAFLGGRGRLAEAAHLVSELMDAADLKDDYATAEDCAWAFDFKS